MHSPSTSFQCVNSPLSIKSRLDKTNRISPVQEPWKNLEEDEAFARAVCCIACGHVITHGAEEVSINGAHRHVFANPYGIVFETVCYKWARGCVVTGLPSDEFTWFPGYRWQIALCGACFNHLGWRFISSTDAFFCLICDQLIFF